ncbi:MAG: hypothetical protein M3Z87_16675 [Lactobacillus sp.]|nr:hypothetical protein [Lactobacillus sp.]
MTKSKKMYNKSFIQAQATEMAKAAGLEGISLVGVHDDLTEEEYQEYMKQVKQKITESLFQIKNSKNKKIEKVVLNKKQLCAGIQFLKILYYSYLNDLDPDSEEAADALKFVNSCDRMNKMLWALMDYDDTINVPFEIPSLSGEED